MKTEGSFSSSNGRDTVFYTEWAPEVKPVAVVQFVHGMSEYVDRYDALAKYLNSFGIAVIGNDHIGHGRSSRPEDYGYFAPSGGERCLVSDVEKLHGIAKEKYPNRPYIIAGHSMGSFITRLWLETCGTGADGIILMGTAGSNPALGVGIKMTEKLIASHGDRAKSKLINAMAFGSYDKKISESHTVYSWLCTDPKVVEAYEADPACGFSFTLGGYRDMFTMLKRINEKEWYKRIPKDIPILLLTGSADPVGNYGKGVAEVAEKLEAAGCEEVTLHVYEGMRHELHNEIGKEAVYEDLRDFVLSFTDSGISESEEADGE